jgi:hypothetical protein
MSHQHPAITGGFVIQVWEFGLHSKCAGFKQGNVMASNKVLKRIT